MNFICPVCGKDLERFFDNNPFSIFQTDYIECPNCKSILEGEYDEILDGNDETQLFHMNIIEVIK